MGIIDKRPINQYKEFHVTQQYGFTLFNISQNVIPCIAELGANSVLYYGCGQSLLYQRMQMFFPSARIAEIEDKYCVIKIWHKNNKHLIKRFLYKWRKRLAKKKLKYLMKLRQISFEN